MNQEDIKTKSQKANEIVNNCNNNLKSIRKKQSNVIGVYNETADKQKIEKVKKQIEAL
jgi:hypothetical protein